MYVAWKISRYLGYYVDIESMLLKILFIFVSKLELWHLANLRFPPRRAYLFTFIVESSSSYKKHQLESAAVICMLCF